jgi:hypothetical protein
MQGRLAVECDGEFWHGPDRYEQDMARQRDLERAGWQFVRIRGGEFYRDQAKAMEPLWAELERLGIRPGGIDENVGEPPSPAHVQNLKAVEPEEIVRDESTPDDGAIADAPTTEEARSNSSMATVSAAVQPVASGPLRPDQQSEAKSGPSTHFQAQYVPYVGAAEADPRTVTTGVVADGLVRIIDCEGPMIAKRAYDVYLRSCGIRRLGGELKSIMNKALTAAIRQGRVVSVNEPGKSGIIHSTVFIKGKLEVYPRCRGPRTFDEIPPNELRAVSKYVLERNNFVPGSDVHLRAILECYDLKRLTTQVGSDLLDAIRGLDSSA